MSQKFRLALAGAALSALTLLAGAPNALAQDTGGGGPDPTTASAAERTSSQVLPAVVYIEVAAHSYLRNLTTGQVEGPFDGTGLCTGFGVSSTGVIATAGHCVSDEDLKGDIALSAAQQSADPEATMADITANWKIEGEAAGSSPDRVVTVYRAGQPLAQAKPMTAQILDSQPNSKTDVALLKVDTTDLSTLDLAPSGGVNTGAAITSIGFPAIRDTLVDPSLIPTFKSGTVSSQQQRAGVPFVEISADMGHGMSGGPTIDAQGRVVGVNSMGLGEQGDSFNFVAPTSALLDMMNRNGIRPQAGPSDLAYRNGLNAYYGGRYSEAVADFGQVVEQQPDNRPAADMKARAAQALQRFGDQGGSGFTVPLWAWIGGGALLVLALGGGVVLLVRRTGRGTTAPAPGRYGQAPYGQAADNQPQYGQAPYGQAPSGQAPYGAAPQSPQSPPHGVPMAAPVDQPQAGATMSAPEAGSTAVLAGPAAERMQHCSRCGAGTTPGAFFCTVCGGAMG